MDGLIECVPNFSEGRDPEVVEAIAQAVDQVPGVALLDHGADADHNRCVLTFAGTPEAVLQAALAAAAVAVERIDMRSHKGVHPRIGAMDVVPFVPIGTTPMSVCVEIAHRFGKLMAAEYGVPVYYYEEAATRPERKSLADIRRGQLEGLAKHIGSDAAYKPDEGAPRLHETAGAVAVGARPVLIAFNVNLDTNDVSVARAIASRIRERSGGMPGIKALGLELATQGVVQVSMNITNYLKSGMGEVYDAIARIAADSGVGVRNSELIGLVPRAALEQAARSGLKLGGLERTAILEERIRESLPGAVELTTFMSMLASKAPAPGGGAAAALTGSLAAATAEKVLAIAGAKLAAAEDLRALRKALRENRWQQIELVDRDARAYQAFSAALKLPRSTDDQKQVRREALAAAAKTAADVPLAIAEYALEVLRTVAQFAGGESTSLIADLQAAAAFANAAINAALAMVAVNVGYVGERAVRERLVSRPQGIREEAAALRGVVEEAFRVYMVG